MSTAPAIGPSQSDPEILRATGDWTLKHASRLLELIEAAPARAKDIDGRDISQLDSTGAMLLSRYATRVGLGLSTVEVQQKYLSMVTAVREVSEGTSHGRRKDLGFRDALARLGYSVEDYTKEIIALIGFGGLTLVTFFRTLLNPSRVRMGGESARFAAPRANRDNWPNL